jgi:hypothetical protein
MASMNVRLAPHPTAGIRASKVMKIIRIDADPKLHHDRAPFLPAKPS